MVGLMEGQLGRKERLGGGARKEHTGIHQNPENMSDYDSTGTEEPATMASKTIRTEVRRSTKRAPDIEDGSAQAAGVCSRRDQRPEMSEHTAQIKHIATVCLAARVN